MNKILEEKRTYPRIKTNLKVNVFENIYGELTDLSEGGLGFKSSEVIYGPTVPLKIILPGRNLRFKIKARLIWKRDIEDSSLYGLEFVDMSESQRSMLRKEIIRIQVSGLLNEIKVPEIKKNVSQFFLRDMLTYISEIIKLTSHLPTDNKYSGEIGKKFTNLNNQILLKGCCLEGFIKDKIIMNKIKENFRFLVSPWAYKSPIVKRAFEKPRGYPGDYLMLETIYNNRPLAKSGIGLYFDKYFLSNPYAVAVRYRKDKLREIIKREIQQSLLETIKIFNIACGSCREIRELPFELFRKKTVIFSCLDWDEEALEFSRRAVKDFPPNVKFNFIKEDIVNLIKDPRFINSFEKQDLVYSVGLIDYLPDRIFKMFVQFIFSLLKTKGKAVLTHKNKEKKFSPLPPDWFCNWRFVSRGKEEVIHLFYDCGIKNFSLSIETNKFNDIFYFTMIKH